MSKFRLKTLSIKEMSHKKRAGFSLAGLVIIVAVVFKFIFFKSLFANTIPSYSDSTGQFLAMWWMRTQLIPNFHISGWFPGNYNGQPLYQFYFPLPALVFSLVHPLAVGVKLAIVLPILLLPISVYIATTVLGKQPLYKFLAALASLGLLFAKSFTAFGGNIYSTFTGEFSFEWSLDITILAAAFSLAVLTGQGSKDTPIFKNSRTYVVGVLWASAFLSHVIPFALGVVALFVTVLIIVLKAFVTENSTSELLQYVRTNLIKSLKMLAAAASIALLLVLVWVIPFIMYYASSSSRALINFNSQYLSLLVQNGVFYILPLMLLGLWETYKKFDIFGIFVSMLWVLSYAEFEYTPVTFSVTGLRGEPTLVLSSYLLAAIGLSGLLTTKYLLKILPIFIITFILPFQVSPTPKGASAIPSETLSGIQARSIWPQYSSLMYTLKKIGTRFGCGLVNFENPQKMMPKNQSYALSLAPYFTNDCMRAGYGLFFESSNQGAYITIMNNRMGQPTQIEAEAANLQSPPNVQKAMRDMRLLGYKYIVTDISIKNDLTSEFTNNKNYKLVAKSGVYRIFIDKSYTPAVALKSPAHVGSYTTTLSWFSNTPDISKLPVVSKIPTTVKTTYTGATISDFSYSKDSISFNTTKLGDPVYVKIPFYQAWKSASPILEAGASQMLVIPTTHHVVLKYSAVL